MEGQISYPSCLRRGKCPHFFFRRGKCPSTLFQGVTNVRPSFFKGGENIRGRQMSGGNVRLPSAWNSLPTDTELRLSSTNSSLCAGLKTSLFSCCLRHLHLRNYFGIRCWRCFNSIIHIVVKRPCAVYVSAALYKLANLHYITLQYTKHRLINCPNNYNNKIIIITILISLLLVTDYCDISMNTTHSWFSVDVGKKEMFLFQGWPVTSASTRSMLGCLQTDCSSTR